MLFTELRLISGTTMILAIYRMPYYVGHIFVINPEEKDEWQRAL